MNSGKFLLVNTDGTECEIFYNEDLSFFNVFSLNQNKKVIALGSKTGLLYFIKLSESRNETRPNEKLELKGECVHELKFDTKIMSVHWISLNRLVISTCNAINIVQEESSNKWSIVRKFHINWNDKPGVSAAAEMNPTMNDSSDNVKTLQSFLVIGDELGSLHLFKSEQETESPLFSLSKVHGIYGVCDLKLSSVNNKEIWSVGRNKAVLNLRLVLESEESSKLVIVQKIDSCLTWNSKLVNFEQGSYICGFSEVSFSTKLTYYDFTFGLYF